MVLNEALAQYHPAQHSQPVVPAAGGVYSDQQAAAHVGETAMVVGTVATRVGVRGVIKLYKGQPEIVITSREQIVVDPS